MKQEQFNGHTNWDTWNASLWIASDESIYRDVVKLANKAIYSEGLAYDIQNYVESIGLKGDGFDPLKVDWDSIAAEYFSKE